MRNFSPPPPLSKDESGAAALVFALSIIPLIALVGVAVDYARLSRDKTELQEAADAGVLAASLDGAAGGPNDVDLPAFKAAAERVLIARIGDAAVVASVQKASDGSICLSASRARPLYFGRIIGRADSDIGATACAQASSGGVEIALALDNSSSMAASVNGQTKLSALTAAVGDLVDSVGGGDVALSVVPFASAVNVGARFAGAAWFDNAGQSSTHWLHYQRPAAASFAPTSRFELFTAMNVAWGGCVEERPAPYLTSDAPASAALPDSLFVPYLAPDEAGAAVGMASTPDGKLTLNSYLEDSGGSCKSGDAYATADASFATWPNVGMSKLCKYDGQTPASVSSGLSGATGLKPAGPNFSCIRTPLQTLTADTASIKAPGGVLQSMIADGDTNLVSGLMWAWRTLSPRGPFATVGASNGAGLRSPRAYGSKKILVMMTDGMNHWVNWPNPLGSTYSAFGYYADDRLAQFGGATVSSNVREQMDAAFLQGCANAKAAGVEIYTVAFDTPDAVIDAAGKTVLTACASMPSMALRATDVASLREAYRGIAAGVRQLRLVR